jgi:hypothetical protein
VLALVPCTYETMNSQAFAVRCMETSVGVAWRFAWSSPCSDCGSTFFTSTCLTLNTFESPSTRDGPRPVEWQKQVLYSFQQYLHVRRRQAEPRESDESGPEGDEYLVFPKNSKKAPPQHARPLPRPGSGCLSLVPTNSAMLSLA